MISLEEDYMSRNTLNMIIGSVAGCVCGTIWAFHGPMYAVYFGVGYFIGGVMITLPEVFGKR